MAQPIPIVLAGVPGRMAAEVGLAALDPNWTERIALQPVAFTGPVIDDPEVDLAGTKIRLVRPDGRDGVELPEGTVVVDFTEPSAALPNVRYYADRGLPFVLGTTGFDRAEASDIVRASQASAVIAPNMAIPIVLIQTALEYLADRFPNALAGYTASVRESHQSGKKDTSGTAKALVDLMADLGLPIGHGDIQMTRDPGEQETEWGVPAGHLAGHAYHRYGVQSSGGDIRVGFSHDVNGRRIYAEGALAAVEFLAARVAGGSRGEVFSMTDVLANMPAPDCGC